MRRRRGKYGAIKTIVDGITFHSKKESERYKKLKLLELAGEIHSLELQPKFKFSINGDPVRYDSGRQATYSADFRYFCNRRKSIVIEDVKSEITRKDPYYRLKKALVQAIWRGTIIEEIY